MSVITTTYTTVNLGTSGLVAVRYNNFPAVNANTLSNEMRLDLPFHKGTLEAFKISSASPTTSGFDVSVRDREGATGFSIYELVRRSSTAQGYGLADISIPFENGDATQIPALYMTIKETAGVTTGSLTVEVQARRGSGF